MIGPSVLSDRNVFRKKEFLRIRDHHEIIERLVKQWDYSKNVGIARVGSKRAKVRGVNHLGGQENLVVKLGARVYDSWKLQGDVEELWDELAKLGLGFAGVVLPLVVSSAIKGGKGMSGQL
ncbi:hypothetical protein Tco_0413974 [Tanacetum coccineum]